MNGDEAAKKRLEEEEEASSGEEVSGDEEEDEESDSEFDDPEGYEDDIPDEGQFVRPTVCPATRLKQDGVFLQLDR